MSNTVDRDQIVRDVAEVLSMRAEQLGDDADLGDEGLDSVRLMTLVERWRGAARMPTSRSWQKSPRSMPGFRSCARSE